MLRRAQVSDLPRILEINSELDKDQWTKEKFSDMFEYDFPIWVVTDNADRIIGYAVYLVCLDEARILNLVISKSFQGNGLGETLMTHLMEDAAEKFAAKYAMLEVDASNLQALALYTKLGFRVLCVRKNYYTDKYLRDAYLMQAELPVA